MVTVTRPRPADSLLNASDAPTEWAIAAALEPLDKVAMETEARWGIGVLERLVSPETAARFASARKKLDESIPGNDWQEVVKRATVLIRGWKALEKEATAAGHQPGIIAHFWAVEAETGKKFLFVQHERDMSAAVKRYPDHEVWAMREVVRVLADHSVAARFASNVKELFPGAVVTNIRDVPPKRGLEDEIPF